MAKKAKREKVEGEPAVAAVPAKKVKAPTQVALDALRGIKTKSIRVQGAIKFLEREV